MQDRNLILFAIFLLGFLSLRQESHMERIEDKLNDIIEVKEKVKYTKNDVECLTRNIYYEAGVESQLGKFAVAHVTVNRLKTGYWGDSICKVVYAKKQFSWTLQKQLSDPNPTLWAESQSIAEKVLTGHRVSKLMHSLYYHATYIPNPKWADPAKEAGQIGNHVFYNGARGSIIGI
jgi:spore germination cell wall hydrolase CwlJ-like protein